MLTWSYGRKTNYSSLLPDLTKSPDWVFSKLSRRWKFSFIVLDLLSSAPAPRAPAGRQSGWDIQQSARPTPNHIFPQCNIQKGCTVSHFIFVFFLFFFPFHLLYQLNSTCHIHCCLCSCYWCWNTWDVQIFLKRLSVLTWEIMRSEHFRRPKCDKNNFKNQKVTILIQPPFK